MGLKRTATGLLYDDDFELYAVGSHPSGWTSGASNTDWTVGDRRTEMSGQEVRAEQLDSGQGFEVALFKDGFSLADAVLQAVILLDNSVNTQPGFIARNGSGGKTRVKLNEFNDVLRVQEPGTSYDIAYNFLFDTPYTVVADIHGGGIRVKVYDSAGTLLVENSPTVSFLDAGQLGLLSVAETGTFAFWDDFALYSAPHVICTGLPSGYQIQVKNSSGTVVAGPVAEDGTGTATLDLNALPCPLAAVEVLDSGSALVDSLSPTDGVWGGDEYEFVANAAPTADAGTDQVVADSDGAEGEDVTLDGTGSSDPDGDALSYTWSEGGVQIAVDATPTVTLSDGEHTIELLVDDGNGGTDTDQVLITVEAPMWTACPEPAPVAWEACETPENIHVLDFCGLAPAHVLDGNGWTEFGKEGASSDAVIADLADASCDRAAERVQVLGDADEFPLAYDAVGYEVANFRVETSVKQTNDPLLTSMGVLLRGQDKDILHNGVDLASDTEYAVYVCHIQAAGDLAIEYLLHKGTSFSYTELGTHALGASPNTWYNVVMDGEGDRLRGKAWERGTTEPDWQIVVTDSRLTQGAIGLFLHDEVNGGQRNVFWEGMTIEDRPFTACHQPAPAAWRAG